MVFSFLISGLSLVMDGQVEKDSVPFNDLIKEGSKETDKAVKVEVTDIPYGFAYYTDDTTGKFYFVFDDNQIYVAFLSNSDFEKLNDEKLSEHPATIYGYTKTLPSDIKKLAIKAYNDGLEDEYQINSADFDSYFGTLYLDTTEQNISAILCLIIGAFGSLVGFCGFIAQLIYNLRLKSRIKKISDEDWEIVNQELDDKETFYYKNAKIALTPNYLIDFAKGIDVIKYKDILWMYKYELRQNGIKTQMSIIIFTLDKKRHVIAALDGFTKKSKVVNEEIMETIMKKNANMLVGYTKENRKKMKEEYQIKA